MVFKSQISLFLIALVFGSIECKDNLLIKEENKAEVFLAMVNNQMAKAANKMTVASWKYESDIRNETENIKMAATKEFNEFQRKQSSEAKKFDWTHFKETNRRMLENMAVIGTSVLNEADEHNYETVMNTMNAIYSSAKICMENNCTLELDPHLSQIMATSKNYSELLDVWVKWRDASGKKMRKDFMTYYTLGNKAAKLNKLPNKKFQSLDDLWLFPWETPDIKEITAKLLEQLKPFYQKIHAYVRMKLKKQYPQKMPKDGTIPAHLLGNMWAQTWQNVMNTVNGIDPYPELAPIDVSEALKKQKYTSEKMFRLSEKFFTDLGLEKMTDKFWNLSIIDKPSPEKNITMVCHASAWDFFDEDDYRIKMCTDVGMEDLITIHHEMGHIQYYQQYKNQPVVFRGGANPGFHEAIGDLLALSVSTPKHLEKIGLLTTDKSREFFEKFNRKFQLMKALEKFMFLPFGYLMDKWRWDVFSGTVSSKNMNRHWWKLRGELQGLSPPVNRSENDFDPGAKYHIPAGVEYIRYFASHILQFQFHKKLCSFREKNVALHECDIDGDREAGLALKKMLQKGASKKWPQQLQDFVGTTEMDVQPLLEYFKPLQEYLDEQLKGQRLGWDFNVDDYFDSSSVNPSSENPSSVDPNRVDRNTVNVISFLGCILMSIAFIKFID